MKLHAYRQQDQADMRLLWPTCEPPPWTRMIAPLSTPWFPAGMGRRRVQVEAEALPAFSRRGLMLRACEFSHPAIADPFQPETRIGDSH